VSFTNGNINYIYDASGVKLKKVVSNNYTNTSTEYASGFMYENNVLKFFNHPEDGIVDSSEILEENNYYPFGLKHKGYNNVINGTDHPYGFGSMEEQNEFNGTLGWIDITARNYDPALGRWMNLDPLAEMMRRHSPYNYAFNNPIFWTDPDGMSPAATLMNGGSISANDVENSAFGNQSFGIGGSNTNGGRGLSTAGNGSSDGGSEDCCGESIGNYKHHESPKEVVYYRDHKDQKKVVNKASFEAGVLATKVSNDLGGDNKGYSGAIRHAYWMYLLAVELGPELAEKLGLMHEDFEITEGLGKGMNNMLTADSQMDMTNNAWGISMARKNPNLSSLDFEEAFFNAAQNKDPNISILNSGTVPSQTLRATINYRKKRYGEVKKELNSTQHLRIPSIKF